MKRCLLSALAVGLCLTASVMAQVPSYVPSNGLVGWWPFNGNANDESGNGNNGTVNGATLTTDRFGLSNSSYNFNVNNWTWGANGDFIYIPYNSAFNFSEFTVSAWVKKASDGSTISPQGLTIINRFEFGYNNPNGESWGLGIDHGSNSGGAIVSGAVVQQAPSPAPTCGCSSTQTIPINEWKYIIMSYSQSTIRIFVNGLLVCSTIDPNIVINTIGNSGISIGLSTQANGHWGPFDGIIDDIGIWNRALTQQEITELYNDCSTSTITTQPTNQTVNSANTAQFIVNATSGSSFQWQTDLGFGFQNLSNAGQYSGANNDTLVVSNASISNNNQQFRCIVNSAGCADTSDIAVLTVSTVGMNELSVQGDVSLYPNPTQSSFEVQTNLVYSKIEIRDMQGRIVKTENTGKIINVASLQKGTYLVKLIDENSKVIAIQRIIKE